MTKKKSLVLKYALALVGVGAVGGLVFQNCGPVMFSSLNKNVNANSTNACVPSIAVPPQLSFVPSSFDAGQTFTVLIANESSYQTITLDFGDGTQPLAIVPANGATITHVYTSPGSYTITATGQEPTCGSTFTGTQVVVVSACVPVAATLVSTLTPPIPTPPPVAPFKMVATITNSADFSNPGWFLNNATTPQPGGATASMTFIAGNYSLQGKATDSCGSTQSTTPVPFCVASSGTPTVTVSPSTFVAGTANNFTVSNATTYSSININFGDGTTAAIPTTGASAGTISHTYATSGSYTYTVTAVDSCGSPRTSASTPVTVSQPTCTPTAPDGCSGNEYCTGRTSCNPTGTCNTTCNLCGYTGTPVTPVTSCSGTASCTTGGTSCNPTNNCSYVCGACGYTGTPITPVTTCVDNQVCTTGGTSCQPTDTCVTVPGKCGVPSPTPTPSPTPSPTPPPVWPTPTPVTDCNSFCGSYGLTGYCVVQGFCSDVTCGAGQLCNWCNYCNNGVCACPLHTTGQSCKSDESCFSGKCVNGLCL